MPKVVSRYKKKQGPKYNPRTGEGLTDSATVGRPIRNLPSRPEAPDDDTNEDGESAVGSSDSDGKGVSSTRKVICSSFSLSLSLSLSLISLSPLLPFSLSSPPFLSLLSSLSLSPLLPFSLSLSLSFSLL